MYLSEIFEQLTQGELSSLYMGKVDETGIQVCDYPKIVPHVNLAVTELHKRFSLRVDEVTIQQYDQIQKYYLQRRFAQTNADSDEPIKYIVDSTYAPFNGNVLRIEKVIDELGRELFVNESDEYWSVHTPSYDCVQMPYPEKENQMIVTYRADAESKIQIAELDPTTTLVPIPGYLIEALLLYVASRVFSNVNTDGVNEGNNYLAKFEKSVQTVKDLGMDNEDNTYNTRLDAAGWA